VLIAIIPETDKRPLLSCIPLSGGAMREHGMAVHCECDMVGVEELIDRCMVREIMIHEKAVNHPDIRKDSVAVYQCPVHCPLFDHAIRIARWEVIRGPVQIDHHARYIGIEIRDDLVMELVERPGCRIAVILDLSLRERN
jgi:hypothetical protein